MITGEHQNPLKRALMHIGEAYRKVLELETAVKSELSNARGALSQASEGLELDQHRQLFESIAVAEERLRLLESQFQDFIFKTRMALAQDTVTAIRQKSEAA